MNDINNGYDRHLDPPDMDEAEYCESCGQEMELITFTYSGGYPSDKEYKCANQFCPEKFEKYKVGTISVVLDMANHLVEVEQELADTKLKLKSKQHALDVISRVTPSQVSLRDTEYQIRRFEGAMHNLGDNGLSCETYDTLRIEWAEVKKILESYG